MVEDCQRLTAEIFPTDEVEAEMNSVGKFTLDHLSMRNQHQARLQLRNFEMRANDETACKAAQKLYQIWSELGKPV